MNISEGSVSHISKRSTSHQSPLRKAAQSISAVWLCPLSKHSHKHFRCTSFYEWESLQIPAIL